ncbi:MAG: DUF4412 domain-containing protein [candidate division Zixibacteria bacterium]|nr:DUF4412 domain-containing protein [candidate division Zixibacteria bacterium]
MKTIKYLTLISLMTMFVAGSAIGGYVLEQETSVDMHHTMGGDKSKELSTVYIEDDKIKTFDKSENVSTIIDFDSKVLYVVDHDKETYQEIPLEELKTAAEDAMAQVNPQMQEAMKNMPPEQQEMMKKMMGDIFSPVTINKTDETKSILGYKCTKYEGTRQGKEAMEIWATDELKIEHNYSDFMQLQIPGGQEMFKDFSKIEGMPLESHMSMGIAGMKTETHTIVTSIDKKDISSSEFEIPSGYQKTKSDLEEFYKK